MTVLMILLYIVFRGCVSSSAPLCLSSRGSCCLSRLSCVGLAAPTEYTPWRTLFKETARNISVPLLSGSLSLLGIFSVYSTRPDETKVETRSRGVRWGPFLTVRPAACAGSADEAAPRWRGHLALLQGRRHARAAVGRCLPGGELLGARRHSTGHRASHDGPTLVPSTAWPPTRAVNFDVRWLGHL